MKLIAALSLALLLSNGCTKTVAPKTAHATQPSFSATADGLGNHQTSGVLGLRTNGDLVIDETGRTMFNALISRGYGVKLPIPIAATNLDYGLTAYTNNPVEPLSLGKIKTPAFPNPGGLFEMNPVAVDAWPTMTTLSRVPVPAAHPP